VIRRTIRFTPAARDHVRILKRWWRENRSHPDVPQQDIEEALGILAVLPAVGPPYPSSPVPDTRRLYLDRLMCHLYYTFDEKEVLIRALWHARRGLGPELKRKGDEQDRKTPSP
jgi:plasmid stabilization system protein ParE